MSELGDSSELFRGASLPGPSAFGPGADRGKSVPGGPKRTVAAPVESAGWGRGPAPVDGRKFRFDLVRAKTQPALAFSVSKVDRLDADKAGDLLAKILADFRIDTEDETRIYGFVNALFFSHTLNGGSILQPGRGIIRVDGVEFDLTVVNVILGVEARRFYRAYADEIAEVNERVIQEVDPLDPVSMEMYGQLMQVAHERGLQKYPKFAHDSADACVHMTLEERRAVLASKRLVLLGTVNRADAIGTLEGADADRRAQNT